MRTLISAITPTCTDVENLATVILLLIVGAVGLGGIWGLVTFMLGAARARVYSVHERRRELGLIVRYTPTWTNRDAFGPAWDAVERAPAVRRPS